MGRLPVAAPLSAARTMWPCALNCRSPTSDRHWATAAHFPLARSHSRTVLFVLPEASSDPSDDQARAQTWSACPPPQYGQRLPPDRVPQPHRLVLAP